MNRKYSEGISRFVVIIKNITSLSSNFIITGSGPMGETCSLMKNG